MSWLILITAALADGGDRPLARQGEALQERLYAVMEGTEGSGPVTPQYRRRRSGPFLVWQFPDGQVQRYRRSERDTLLEERSFDASGGLLSTVTFGEEGPVSVSVHVADPVTLDVSGWTAELVGDVEVRAPQAGSPRPGDGRRWTVEGGRLEVWSGPAGDVFGDAWRDGLRAGCGCTVLDRVSVWVDGEAGVRYRLIAAGEPDQVVDLWAIPRGDGVWLASYAVAAIDDRDEAIEVGRAAVALVRFGVVPEEDSP